MLISVVLLEIWRIIIEICGIFLYLGVTQHTLQHGVLHLAEACTKILQCPQTQLCILARSSTSSSQSHAGCQCPQIKPEAQLPGLLWSQTIPPPSHLHHCTLWCIMHSHPISPPSPSVRLVCVWAKEDESLLELNEGYIYANFKG